MSIEDRFKAVRPLFKSEQEGDLDFLQCPDCNKRSVSVWFTHPGEEYKTWFLCSECRFQLRIQNGMRPKHFSEHRILPTLQAYDEKIQEMCHFKANGEVKPPKRRREENHPPPFRLVDEE